MTIELVNPKGLTKAATHSQVAIATGSRMVFVAGQVSIDAEGNLVGRDDTAAQITQCYLNLAVALAQVGATFDDVAKLTAYVVDLDNDKLGAFGAGLHAACKKMGIDQPMAPLTGIGVTSLAGPDFLVELEAIAVLS